MKAFTSVFLLQLFVYFLTIYCIISLQNMVHYLHSFLIAPKNNDVLDRFNLYLKIILIDTLHFSTIYHFAK